MGSYALSRRPQAFGEWDEPTLQGGGSGLTMLHPANPFSTMDKEAVIGSLKATGSYDPDVLDARRMELLARVRFQRLSGLVLMVPGIPVSLIQGGVLGGIPMAVIGLPMAFLGWWFWRRGSRNLATVEAGFTEYLSSPGE